MQALQLYLLQFAAATWGDAAEIIKTAPVDGVSRVTALLVIKYVIAPLSFSSLCPSSYLCGVKAASLKRDLRGSAVKNSLGAIDFRKVIRIVSPS
jgi:hypothetical protein